MLQKSLTSGLIFTFTAIDLEQTLNISHLGIVTVFCFVFYKFIYLFLAVFSLRCCPQAFSSCGERGLLFTAVRELFSLRWFLLLWSMGSRRAGFSSCGTQAQ